MICNYCQSENPDSNTMCRFCGNALRGVSKKDLETNASTPIPQNIEPEEKSLSQKIIVGITIALFVISFLFLNITDYLTTDIVVAQKDIMSAIGISLLLMAPAIYTLGHLAIKKRKEFFAGIIILIAIVMSISTSVYQGYTSIREYTSLIDKAGESYVNQNYQDTIKYAEESLSLAEIDEEKALSLYWLGVGYYKTGDKQKAIEYENEMLLINPEAPTFIQSLEYFDAIDKTLMAWQERSTDQIITNAQQAYKLALTDEEKATAAYWLGVGHYRNGNFSEAEKYASQSIELSPSNVGPYVTMGAIYSSLGKTKEARYYAEQAIIIDPTYPWAQNLMGIILFNEGSIKDAIQYFEVAIELSPNTLEFQENLEAAKAGL